MAQLRRAPESLAQTVALPDIIVPTGTMRAAEVFSARVAALGTLDSVCQLIRACRSGRYSLSLYRSAKRGRDLACLHLLRASPFRGEA